VQALFTPAHGAPTLTIAHPGSRQGGLDFRWRFPGLRNWLTFYGDGFTHDEPNPLWGEELEKSAFASGIYLPHLPKLPKCDLRVEGVFTDNPNSNHLLQHGFFYWEATFRSGYTNDGNLLGSWIGRQAQGVQAMATYWFTPKNKLQFSYRHQKVSRKFVPDGGTVSDGGVSADLWARPQYSVTASFQYEKWAFPVLAPQERNNFTTSVQFTFWPRHWGIRADSATARGDRSTVQ
jgi:hypothetical protein